MIDHDDDATRSVERDEMLAAAWDELLSPAPLDDLAAARLARRIRLAAEPRLRRRVGRGRPALARWTRGLIPLGIAAGVAAVALLVLEPHSGATAGAATDRSTLYAAAVGALPVDSVLRAMWSPEDASPLLCSGDCR